VARSIELLVAPTVLADSSLLRIALANAGLRDSENFRIVRRSIDARKRPPHYLLKCEVFSAEEESIEIPRSPVKRDVQNAPEVMVVGSGPCGLFAALSLIENGFKPIVLERGKNIRDRRRDLAALNKAHIVNPESNYCFGEGGAGTYSDGKLYTRSNKRGDARAILEYLVSFGAPTDILVDAHPHIGTNKLPKLIEAIRLFIEDCGGEVRFGSKLTDIKVKDGKIQQVEINHSDWYPCSQLILATGHSARDIFELLHNRGIDISAKDFALGVRVEHPQELIDQIQYKCDRGVYLPPASYQLVHQHGKRGVYSFCMCPGGIIAPCATAPGEIVTNGWSPSKRNNPYANSGLVVSVTAADYDPKGTGHPLLALEYQSAVERSAFNLGGGGQIAPAQRLIDFTQRQISADLPNCSYQPGLKSTELRACLPPIVHNALADGIKTFGQKMRGYFTNEAVLVATESRTSSPVRIPRGSDGQHPMVAGLFPAGEGAGYAGGIVSAAIDGQNAAVHVANAVARGV